MEKSVLVTGASSGIGLASVIFLIQKGFRVFGTVRRNADAGRLQSELGGSFTPLLMDVNDPVAIASSVEQVRDELGRSNLGGLVNNAGITVTGPLLHMELAQFRRQLEVNLVAPLRVIQSFAPLLGTDSTRVGGPGRIVNISSLGGRMGPPFLGAYAASKHGLEGMSESLRRELLLYGIDVIVIEPGFVATLILDKAESEDLSMYDSTDYAASLSVFTKGYIAEARKALAPVRIAETVHLALTTRRPKVCYTVMQKKFMNWTLPRLMPKRRIDRLIGKQIGLIPMEK